VKDDLIQLFESVRADLEREDVAGAAVRLEDAASTDVADLLASLASEERILLVRAMPADRAAEVLAEIDDRSATDVLELLQDAEIVDMLDTLPSDDAADLVGQLDEQDQDRLVDLLGQVDRQDALELRELLRYPEDTAGGVMAKEYLAADHDQSVGTVQQQIRRLPDEELDQMHYCFVVDEDGRLVGQVGLLKLLLSPVERRLREVMDDEPLVGHVSDDQEEIANMFLWHDLVSLPIVDAGQRLVGRVTVDDAMDVLTEEATEDVARLAGSSAEEVGETSVWRIGRARLPWLLLGLVGQLVAAVVMSTFEESLRTRVILAFFVPMVMATGGNTGMQTSSIMIRLLVTHDLDRLRAGRHLLRELGVALVLGAVLGGVMVGVLAAWKQDVTVGVVIGLSLMAVVVMSAMVGSLVPLLCERTGVDPTVATGPFITTTNDVLGLLAYLWIAEAFLGAV